MGKHQLLRASTIIAASAPTAQAQTIQPTLDQSFLQIQSFGTC
jgi:hypothetical protein